MPRPTKYKKKYTKQLLNGLRQDGKSEAEVCAIWGITKPTYDAWKVHPEFLAAHETGVRDAAIWWHQLNRKAATGEIKANAGLIQFALKNIEGIGWVETKPADSQETPTVHRIEINILPPKQLSAPEARVIEHDNEDD